MIERSIDAHMELFNRANRVFAFIDSYYTADGTLALPDEEKSNELHGLLVELHKWTNSKGFFLDKTIKKQIGLVIGLGERARKPGAKVVSPKMDVGEQMWRAMNGLREALETIMKEYNPLYDLNIKLPEIDTP
jgi:hypothetical protein